MSMRPVIAIVVGAVTLAGCGGRGATAVATVQASTEKTLATKTAQVSEDIHIVPATANSAVPTSFSAQGAINFVAHQARMELNVVGQQVEVILDGGVIYEKIPALAQSLGGKPWIKIDLQTVGQAVGISNLGSLSQGTTNDPSQGLQFLRGISGSVTTLGTETVRGVRTTHYRVPVDLQKAADQSPSAQQAALHQIVDKFGVHATTVDVWVDDQGLVRRYHQRLDYHPPPSIPNAAAFPKAVEVTTEFYGFGTSVPITVPPADQVADLADLGNPSGTPATPPAAGSPSAKLAALLITALPVGYQQQADSVGDTGPSDLAKAVSDDGRPEAQQALTADGFVAGYQRLWQKGDDQIVVFLYQFRSAIGAAAYQRRSVADAVVPKSADDHISAFAVAGIPGGRGFTSVSSEGTADAVLFARGSYVVQVVSAGSGALPATAVTAAQQQYSRL